MPFQLPRYEKCCFCIPLRIGSMFIGYVSIIASCITIALVSWSIYKVSTYVQENENKPNPEHPPEDFAKAAMGLYVSFGYHILVFLYNLVIGVILVVGVHTNKPRLLRIYFKGAIFLFVLSLALVVVTCVFMGFLATLPVLKWCFTLLCCLVTVRSTYLQMEDTEKPRVYEMQPFNAQEAPLSV